MNKLIANIIFFFILFISACSYCDEESKKYDINGKYELENLGTSHVHGVFHLVYDSLKHPEEYLCTSFSLTFDIDSSYLLQCKNGKTMGGRYHQKSDTLILLKKDYNWLVFNIDSIVNNRLFLNLNYAVYYYIENDTITYLTGEKVKFIFKKID